MKFPFEIDTWENNQWSITSVSTIEELRELILGCFKEPGKYELDETIHQFNPNAQFFRKEETFSYTARNTKDFITYWDFEKRKCRNGVIFKNGKKYWYLPRDYYMWLNFLPIYDKMEKKYDFPQIWDVQLHMALYEFLAEIHYRHAAVFKKRQIASSYFHAAKLTNKIWFEEGVTLKMGASLKDYINQSGTWAMLEEYRNFLNTHTAWYRPMNPGKVLEWQQKMEVLQGNKKVTKGLKGRLLGLSFEQSDTRGVGGATELFFYEEAGIAPTMNVTYEFLRPALKMGELTTGLFVAAGSVGKISDAEPLKEFILNPEANDIYAIDTDLLDERGTRGKTGLFIPEQWGMPPYIDEFGNSKVKEALEALDKTFTQAKKDLAPAEYQLRISQHPRNIKEGFAHREVSKFDVNLLSEQEAAINNHEYPFELIDLEENLATGELIVKKTNKPPINQWPVKKDLEDKEGSIVVWERPDKDLKWGTYVASIDPVGEGRAEYVENLLYTPNGKKRIGDIKIGDYVMHPSGQATKVLEVYPQGKKELYRISFNDGFSILVCKEHLWNVKASDNDRVGYHTISTEQLIDPEKRIEFTGIGRNVAKLYSTQTYYKKTNNQFRWRIPISQPLLFNSKKIPLNAYLLGLLLGDGGITGRSTMFTTVDLELLDYIKEILPSEITIKKSGNCSYRLSSSLPRNSITKTLRELGLQGCGSKTKFIPDIYKIASVQERLNLLQGLMDTDGYCGNHGAEYYSISKQLAYDVVELTQSLGGIAKIRKKITNRKVRNGVGYIYIVRVCLPEPMNPFKLIRKAALYKQKYTFSRYISNIEFEKIDEAVCIKVDASDGLYVTEHAIVTHNTSTSESLCSIYIYKRATRVQKHTQDEIINYVEGDKIVAAWCGRFHDINQTHKRLRLMIEWYMATTLVENNVSLFIQYMIKARKQKFLVRKNEMLFLKEIGANESVYQEYGWKNTGTLFKNHLLNYLIEFIKEVVNEDIDEFGNIQKRYYGVKRIPDIMAIKEMLGYSEGVNVDRLVALTALIAYVRILDSNSEKPVRVENVVSDLHNTKNLYKLNNNAFRNIGKSGQGNSTNKNRTAFKHVR